jgi:16S rRNA (adenine1518-N6/adenine1519-N6)-dimethyltransferase
LPDTPARDLPPLRSVIARHGLAARKGLGQNFLLDLNLTRRIVRAAGDLSGSVVVEIGPGPGGLTRALLETPARRVIAIERDRRCIAALAELEAAYPGRLHIIEGDALALDAAAEARARAPDAAIRIVANLPYNIATALLLRWLGETQAFAGLTLMFQKEVAERLVAGPGSRAYGRLSVITQWLCQTERLFDIAPRAFVPPPKVTSSLVAFTPRAETLAPAPRAALEAVTAAAFGQRRKMLRAALRTLVDDPEALLNAAGIAPTARAETLDIADFCTLARGYAALKGGISA